MASTPFHDIGQFLALPRLGELRLSPDGQRLVVTVSVLDDDGAKRTDSLWDVDPEGTRPARRLTWSAKGESAPRWLPDGSLLFLSSRDAAGDDEKPASQWLLPADGGEASKVLERPGGVAAVEVARGAARYVVSSPTLPRATNADDDERLRKERKDRKVNAV